MVREPVRGMESGAEAPGAGHAPPATRGGGVAAYDFRRPHRVSKERLRTLEAMYERLVKSLEGWMVGRVRGQVELTLRGVEQLGFSDLIQSLDAPCTSYLVDIRDSGGQQAVIDFSTGFAFYLVDRMLGGRGVGDPPRRALTPIERMVVRTVADRIAGLVREIWADYIPLELSVTGFESVPEILRATGGDAAVLVAVVDVEAGGSSSTISITLPFGVLDAFFGDSAAHRRPGFAGSEVEREENRRLVEAALRVTHLPVAARLPDFRISMRNLTGLTEGSVLPTGLPRDAEIDVLIAGVPRYRGRPARIGNKLAISVTDEVGAAAPAARGDAIDDDVNPFEEL